MPRQLNHLKARGEHREVKKLDVPGTTGERQVTRRAFMTWYSGRVP
jgi:hypothetical protein